MSAAPTSVSSTGVDSPHEQPGKHGIFEIAAAALCFSVIAVLLQTWAGSYRTELCAYPDEPAHAVTGVAVEQYFAHGLGQSPGIFLLDYYRHYPKVAIGHWPPLLYILEAAAMLPFSPSVYSLLGLQALLAGLLAALLFRELRPLVGTLAAAVGGCALLFNRDLLLHASMAMAEVLLTLTMFLACLAFARYAERRKTRDAVWFGIWVSAAVLTKGTGWAALLVPAVVLLVTRDWKLPFERTLRPAILIVTAACLPWQLLTLRLASEGWTHKPGLAYVQWAIPQFTRILFTLPGVPIAVCATLGAGYALIVGRETERTRVYWASIAGLAIAAWLFHVLIPAGVERRKLIIALPALFVLAGEGTRILGEWIAPRRWRPAAGTLFASLAILTIAFSLPIEAKLRLGLLPVAAALDRTLPSQSAALLVGNFNLEGSIIADFALRHPQPAVYLLRGTSLLATQTWNGNNYRLRVQSAEECSNLLASVPIDVLVIDRRKSFRREPHCSLVEDMLQTHRAEWVLMQEFQTPSDSPHAVAIYERATGIEALRQLPPWVVPPIRLLNSPTR